jgi:alanine racemase
VSSPTYLLVVEHPGPVPMVHADAYFPHKTRSFLADGGLDYLGELAAVVVVEWAERVADLLPQPALWVWLEPAMVAGRPGRVARLEDRDGSFGWIAELPARLG